MKAVALIVVDRRNRRVDRNLVEVRTAESGDLRVDVGVNAAGEQRVVREIDPRNHMRRAKRHLLRLSEEVVGVAIEHEAADRSQRNQLLGNDLRRIENVEAELLRLFFGENL